MAGVKDTTDCRVLHAKVALQRTTNDRAGAGRRRGFRGCRAFPGCSQVAWVPAFLHCEGTIPMLHPPKKRTTNDHPPPMPAARWLENLSAFATIAVVVSPYDSKRQAGRLGAVLRPRSPKTFRRQLSERAGSTAPAIFWAPNRSRPEPAAALGGGTRRTSAGLRPGAQGRRRCSRSRPSRVGRL